MKKILSLILFVVVAFAVNAQSTAGPLVVCDEGEACAANPSGHFHNGVVPYSPPVDEFPEIRTCEPLDMCITLKCPETINPQEAGLANVNFSLSVTGIEVTGFGGLPEGVSYCLSDANWTPGNYYTLHLTGVPQQAGAYQLKLSAAVGLYGMPLNTDNVSQDGVNAVLVTVVDGPALAANFSASATEIAAGNAVDFTNTSTGYQETRTWTFEGGNPATSTDENPRVMYSTPGTYQVSLTVTNACGGEDTKTSTITVTEPLTGEAPVADFSSAVTILQEGFSVQFIDLSTNIPTSWNWTFANGTPETSTEQNPVVTFAEEGDYLVTLVAENEYGRDSIARTISIVGINDYNVDDMVSIYPNPTSSILNIEADDLVSVTILDMSGRIVYFADENCSAASIDLSGFAQSEYMIKVETRKGTSVKRIIKM
ncbi:MAG: PKD domain-containing protein [Bacteroidales bacterium]|nr:PKD domain-containing protein [Bacteroidales bacterium]